MNNTISRFNIFPIDDKDMLYSTFSKGDHILDSEREHDRHMIELLDGTHLQGYPKESASTVQADEVSLDTSGEYLSAGKSSAPKKTVSTMEQANYLLSNISVILDNAERILSDSRLFLTPVPIENGLAYSGPAGFQNPTLGVYAEWWKQFPAESHDAEENPIWFISGSPMSGANACSSVARDGSITECCELQNRFKYTWQSFIEVNKRYTEAKATCEAYTLDQAIQILSGK